MIRYDTPPSLPPRLMLMAVEGWGKTTFGAYAPEPAIIMAGSETGYLTLLAAGRVPAVEAVMVENWQECFTVTAELAKNKKTIVLDTIDGFERLCHEYICQRDFNGEWGERGFAAYQRGPRIAGNEWARWILHLETLRIAHNVSIIVLSHVSVKIFSNPMGENFDRYEATIDKWIWEETRKWVDAILFGTFLTRTIKSGLKAKGVGGADRIVYTERRDAFYAKNRYGMPETILLPPAPEKSYETIAQYLKGAAQ
jgi:hypothetical protein